MDEFDRLNWTINYHRAKQVERLEAHIKENNSIASFLYDHAEYSLDNIFTDWQLYHAKLSEPTKKKFWQRKN